MRFPALMDLAARIDGLASLASLVMVYSIHAITKIPNG